MNPKQLAMLVMFVLALGLGVAVDAQTVIYVDDDAAPGGDGLSWATAYDSLFTALTAAAPGDQIWVAAGTYVGNFTLALEVGLYGGFAGTETELTQRDWTANPTILDGDQSDSVVTSPPGATETTRIDGFTITKGSAWGGGGLYLFCSSPTIADNTITGNRAGSEGGGLYLDQSSPTIANNTITSNRADHAGGGLYLYGSYPTIVNNIITRNNASSGPGGGLYLSHSSPTIANNTITGNSASWRGGGVCLRSPSSPTIASTIVAFNSSGIHQSGAPGTPTLRYNCVYGNTGYDYFGFTDPTGTDGNISDDPLFVQNPNAGSDGIWGTDDDDLGDLQLASGSPCIDAGDNAAVPADTLDLDGDGDTTELLPFDLPGCARFVDYPKTEDTALGTQPIVDMGAYECRPGDCNHDCGVDLLDYVGFEGCLLGPGGEVPSECQCFDLDASGHVDLADFAVFQLAFTGGRAP